jgi:hypothetical protein
MVTQFFYGSHMDGEVIRPKLLSLDDLTICHLALSSTLVI